jgi:DNA primase
MFPIFDAKQRVVGFGGRTLNDTIQPKYLNSAENEVFHKGEILYGFHLIEYKESSVILVEGYLDVIALVQAGFKNVFAPMGTAVTQEQAKKLLKHFNKIYICFDGDSAGFKAMSRAADIFLPLLQPGVELLFIQLPEGQDPHSLITSGSITTFNQRMHAPLNLIEFLKAYEDRSHPGSHPSALALHRKHMLDRIAMISDSFLKSLYKDQIYKLFQSTRFTKKINVPSVLPKATSVQDIYEAVLIKTFILYPTLYKEFMDQLHAYHFSQQSQKILAIIENYFFSGDKLEFSLIVPYIKQHLSNLNIDHILNDTWNVHAPFLYEPVDENTVRQRVVQILEYFNDNTSLDAHIKEAQQRFKESQNQTDWDRLKILMAQKQRQDDE